MYDLNLQWQVWPRTQLPSSPVDGRYIYTDADIL